MRIPRIYTEQTLEPGQSIELETAAATHLARVLRAQPGQPVELFNGDGNNYAAELTEVGRRQVSLRVISRAANPTESPLALTLAQVISKGERMDLVVQKSTELGVRRIIPLTSERCDVRLSSEREDKRIRRWQSIAQGAAEQCGRSVVPQIDEVIRLQDWLTATRDFDEQTLRLVLHHRNTTSLGDYSRPSGVVLLVGPEGGLSEQEIEAAHQAGFGAVAFGPRVLRTETAPLTGLSLCQYLWGDFGGASSSDPVQSPKRAQ